MGMPALAHRWTREEVLALPDDGNRYELVDGELLVSPSPRFLHQAAVLELLVLLHRYAEAHRPLIGTVCHSPADLDLRSGQLLQPDVFVAPRADGRRVRDWHEVGIPLLVAEVLSPRTARFDRVVKRQRFQRSGVPTYWIVDVDARLVEIWTPEAERPIIATESVTWQPDANAPALTIDLVAYFRAVCDEQDDDAR
jgi:Uma2 family endonuclease